MLPWHRCACAGRTGQPDGPVVCTGGRASPTELWGAVRRSPSASVILRGGPILTVDEANPVGEALAIRGSTILGVGSLTEVKRHYTPGTEIVDLEGHAVLPGFVEPHVHVLQSALADAGIADGRDRESLRGCTRASRGDGRPHPARPRACAAAPPCTTPGSACSRARPSTSCWARSPVRQRRRCAYGGRSPPSSPPRSARSPEVATSATT